MARHHQKTFENVLVCSHGDIDYDEYGNGICKLCYGSQSDINDLRALQQLVSEGKTVREIKSQRLEFHYYPISTQQINQVRKDN